MAEISRRFSPYAYVENNPIRNIDPDGMYTLTGASAQDFFRDFQAQVNQSQSQDDPKKKKQSAYDVLSRFVDVKNGPKINKLTHWWQRAIASFEGGRDYKGITYDNDGNPEHIAYNKMEINLPFGPSSDIRAGEFFTERVLGFFVKSSIVVEGGTYTRTVSILANVENEKSLFQLLKSFESDAAAKGASNVVLKGTEVLNEKLFNPAVAARLGYRFEKLADHSFKLTKALTK